MHGPINHPQKPKVWPLLKVEKGEVENASIQVRTEAPKQWAEGG